MICFFFYVSENTVLDKKWMNHQKILVCYTKSCYKNISKICTSTFIFHNLKNVKKIEKIHMDSEKSINSFEIEKGIGHLIIYRTIILFGDL